MKKTFRFLLPSLLALALPSLLSAQWLLTGNNNVAAASFLGSLNAQPVNFGTLMAQPVNFITGGIPRMQLSAAGLLGIGTAPLYQLHVANATNVRSGSFTNTLSSTFPTFGLFAETNNTGTGTEAAGFFKAQGSGTGANFGVDAYSSQSSATNYGVRSTVVGSGNSTNYGLRVAMTPSAASGSNFGVYSAFNTAAAGINNFSGYFGNGKVYINYRLGIGLTAPLAELHVKGAENTGSVGAVQITSGTENMLLDGNEIDALSGGLHLNSNSSQDVLLVNGGGRVGIGTASPGVGAKLHVKGGNLRLENNGDYFDFKVGPGGNLRLQRNGTTTALFISDTDGRVGIGTDQLPTITNERLAVKGGIKSDEISVSVFPWPDYVFEPDHKLLSLPEVKSFVEANRHLPGIPSADEVEKDGLLLGKMQSKMMEKIEELYLHVIQMNERVKVLEKENTALRQGTPPEGEGR